MTACGRPSSGALRAEMHRTLEPLARIAPRVFSLYERLERLARADGRRRDDDQAMNRAAHDIELGRGCQDRIELGAERVNEHSKLAALLAEGLGSRARSAAAPVADRDVDLVPRIERAVPDRDHETLEPGSDIAARLPGQVRNGRRAARLEAHGRVVRARRIAELRRSPIGRETRGDLEPRELVVAVGADLVGDRPGAELAGDDRRGGGNPRPPDVSWIGVDRHQDGSWWGVYTRRA